MYRQSATYATTIRAARTAKVIHQRTRSHVIERLPFRILPRGALTRDRDTGVKPNSVAIFRISPNRAVRWRAGARGALAAGPAGLAEAGVRSAGVGVVYLEAEPARARACHYRKRGVGPAACEPTT